MEEQTKSISYNLTKVNAIAQFQYYKLNNHFNLHRSVESWNKNLQFLRFTQIKFIVY
jgi:hypothetical protein